MKNNGGTCQIFGSQRPGKVRKQKRTRLSSASSAGFGIGAGRTTIEEDLQIRLQNLQDMFTSSRPVSVLYLRGEHLDDPDRYPVSPAGACPLHLNWKPSQLMTAFGKHAAQSLPLLD